MMTDISSEGAGFQGSNFSLLQVGQNVEVKSDEFGSLYGTIRWTGISGFGIRFDEKTRNSPKLMKLLL